MRGNFDHTGKLVRFILRRERIVSSLWIALLALFSITLAPGISTMFDAAARAAYAMTMDNPAMVAMMGPAYGAENFTVGAMYSNTMLLWIIIAVAVMNIFLVVRHTRSDEEKGRTEVVRSLPTGRLANLSAAWITAVIVNAALALVIGTGIGVMGIESVDFMGSMLYGAALGVSGLFFAAVAALFSQLSSSSRGATGLSLVALGLIYMLRAAGDINNESLSLISPMGLIQRSQIYVENHWWPVLIVLLEAIVVVIAAFALNSIRDMGQGFFHARPGRREASAFLRSPFGLSLRLTRNMLAAWIISIFVLGAAYGSILGDIEKFVSNSDFYAQMIGTNANFSTAQMFVSMVTAIMALFALIPVLTAVLKVRNEEKEGRAELVLTHSVTRGKYLSGYVILAFAASILAQCATALGTYAAAVSVLPDPGTLTLGYLLKANLVYLPAMWLMTGIAVVLTAVWPKAVSAIWGYFGFIFFATFVGRIPGLFPEWFAKLTPYGYIPQLPADSINYGTLAILTAIAAALTAIGFICYRRRDVAAN